MPAVEDFAEDGDAAGIALLAGFAALLLSFGLFQTGRKSV